MLSRLKFDIKPLVNEMLDRLPADVWTRTDTTFLDPAMAGGQFIVEICNRLQTAGHSWDNIEARVFGLADSPLSLNFAKNKYKIRGQFSVGGIETLEQWATMGKKFDVVIGNPPYQDGKDGSKNTIYPLFYRAAMSLVADKGIVAMVTPAAMIKGLAGEVVDKFQMPQQRNVLNINVSNLGKKYFGGVGSTFCYFVVRNENDTRQTVVTSDRGSVTIAFNGLVSSITTAEAYSILDKCFTTTDQYGCTTSDCGKKSIKTPSGDVEVVRTINNDGTLDTYRVDIFNKQHGLLNTPKIMFSIVGKKSYVDYTHNMMPSAEHLLVSIATTNDVESESLKSILESKLASFYAILTNETRGYYYNFIRRFKKVPLNKIWTDAELYAHFNLTQEEIDLIEATVK